MSIHRLTGTSGSPAIRGRGVATCGPRHVLPSCSRAPRQTHRPLPRAHAQAVYQKGRNIVVAVDEDEVSGAIILTGCPWPLSDWQETEWQGTVVLAKAVACPSGGPKHRRMGKVILLLHHAFLCLQLSWEAVKWTVEEVFKDGEHAGNSWGLCKARTFAILSFHRWPTLMPVPRRP